MKQHTFPKAEHLCLKSEIDALFRPGSTSLSTFPLRATFCPRPYAGRGPRVKVLISVAKRRLRHATDRNRAKRQIREAYRLQKELLAAALPEGLGLNVAFIWLSDTPLPTSLVSARMRTVLLRLGERAATRAAAERAATAATQPEA